MARYTTQDLHQQIVDTESRVNTRIGKVEEKLEPIHEYFIGQQAIAEAQDKMIKKQIRTGDIIVSRQVWSLLIKVVGFVGTALTIIWGLINARQ